MTVSLRDSIDSSECDKLRSNHIRELVLNPPPADGVFLPSVIPKVLVQFWHDLNKIPEDVKSCLTSWEGLEKDGFRRIIYDKAKARKFILAELGSIHATAFDQCHHPAMQCDYFRLCYILVHGGFYVDADEIYCGADCSYLFKDSKLKVQPFCYDNVNQKMVDGKDFTIVKNSPKDWTFYLNNNPIISPPNHTVIRLALERSTRILLRPGNLRADIQSTTGPGNLTASLVRHSIESISNRTNPDFYLIFDWDSISKCRWNLDYRGDDRNWRNWNKGMPQRNF